MRLTISFIVALLASIAICGQQPLNLIPYPVKVEQLPGTYVMKNKMTFSSAFPAQEQSRVNAYLKDQLKKNYNIDLVEAVKGQPADIILSARRMPTSGKIAYELKVDKQGIRIDANFDVAAFYAVQTLLQLLPADGGAKREVPYVTIFDQPRFDYRGMHLDVGRHFFPVPFIKRYIDYLAYHKFNTFHAANICNFMRVANCRYCTMHHGQFSKFRRNQHGAFDMNVAVDKTGKNVVRLRLR